MKFTCSVTINKPRQQVVDLWQDPENLKHWQDGFVDFKHLEGDPGHIGAVSRMRYKIRNRDLELIETIQHIDLPNEMTAMYESKPMNNTMRNTFTMVNDTITRWDAEIHYTEMNGFVVKMMAALFPGMFKKQAQKWFDQFKAFAEEQKS